VVKDLDQGAISVARALDSLGLDPATLDAKAVSDYAGQAKAQTVTDFVLHIIPNTIVDAFTRGDILQEAVCQRRTSVQYPQASPGAGN